MLYWLSRHPESRAIQTPANTTNTNYSLNSQYKMFVVECGWPPGYDTPQALMVTGS
jgi:hypothetical protein